MNAPQTLIKIGDDDDFIVFDTNLNEVDIDTIRRQWLEAKNAHPTWDRYDLIGELIEDRLPKFGLQGTYLCARNVILN